MSIIKPEDLDNLRHSAKILRSALYQVEKVVKPGSSAGQLDRMVEAFIYDHDAVPAFKGLYGYPYTLITELNEEVVHGMSPDSKIIPETCILSFDCGVSYKGMFSDMCILMTFGDVSAEVKMLEKKTREALEAGIKAVKAGKRVGDIGHAVDTVIQGAGLGNVLDLGGHGIGYKPHSEPHITHAGKPGSGARLFENQCICIEPMVTLGDGSVDFVEVPESDMEVVVSCGGEWAAHIEHQLLVTKKGCEVLTDIPIEKLLNA